MPKLPIRSGERIISATFRLLFGLRLPAIYFMSDEKFIPPTAAESARGNVWAQMEKDGKAFEPIGAYEFFLRYCEMPAPRSVKRLAQQKGVKITSRTLENYSAKYSWQTRAFAYDRHVAALEQNAKDVARFHNQRKWTERREMVRNNEWTDAQELRKKAKEFLAMPLIEEKVISEEVSKDGKKIIKHIVQMPIKGTLNDVVRMIDLADKLERNAVDAETERIIIDTPESRRQSDVLKARAAFERSGELFPNTPERERAEGIARAFNVTTSEILAPEEILPSIVQETISNLPN